MSDSLIIIWAIRVSLPRKNARKQGTMCWKRPARIAFLGLKEKRAKTRAEKSDHSNAIGIFLVDAFRFGVLIWKQCLRRGALIKKKTEKKHKHCQVGVGAFLSSCSFFLNSLFIFVFCVCAVRLLRLGSENLKSLTRGGKEKRGRERCREEIDDIHRFCIGARRILLFFKGLQVLQEGREIKIPGRICVMIIFKS